MKSILMIEKHTFDEILSKSFSLYKSNIKAIMIIALLISLLTLFSNIGTFYLGLAYENQLNYLSNGLDENGLEFNDTLLILMNNISQLSSYFILIFFIIVIVSILSLTISAILIYYFYNHLKNGQASLAKSFNKIKEKLFVLIITNFIVGLAFFLIFFIAFSMLFLLFLNNYSDSSSVLFLVLGSVIIIFLTFILYFYCIINWAFYMHAIVIRNYHYFNSISYSIKLVKYNFWRTLGYLIVVGFIIGGVVFAITIVSLFYYMFFGLFILQDSLAMFFVHFPVEFIINVVVLFSSVFTIVYFYGLEKEKGLDK